MGTSEELFKSFINELKREFWRKFISWPINNHLHISSIDSEQIYGVCETLVIVYSTVHNGKIIPFKFYFKGTTADFIEMFDHEGGYNRFEEYVSGKLRELGNKLIEDSNRIIKEGF